MCKAHEDCIFCKIVSGQIPADKVWEDDLCLAFRDLNPQAPVHILVIPKKHIPSLAEARVGEDASGEDEAILGRVLSAAARIARQEGIEEAGYRTVFNTNSGAGQQVYHIHLHLLGGRNFGWPPG